MLLLWFSSLLWCRELQNTTWCPPTWADTGMHWYGPATLESTHRDEAKRPLELLLWSSYQRYCIVPPHIEIFRSFGSSVLQISDKTSHWHMSIVCYRNKSNPFARTSPICWLIYYETRNVAPQPWMRALWNDIGYVFGGCWCMCTYVGRWLKTMALLCCAVLFHQDSSRLLCCITV